MSLHNVNWNQWMSVNATVSLFQFLWKIKWFILVVSGSDERYIVGFKICEKSQIIAIWSYGMRNLVYITYIVRTWVAVRFRFILLLVFWHDWIKSFQLTATTATKKKHHSTIRIQFGVSIEYYSYRWSQINRFFYCHQWKVKVKKMLC